MGDRTTVVIKIRKNDYRQIITKYFECTQSKFDEKFSPTSVDLSHITIVELLAEECNYAEWGALEKFLEENKIEFDKFWESGGNYESGSAYGRMVKGKFRVVEIYKTEESVLDFIKTLRAEKDPKEVLKIIENTYKHITPFEVLELNRPNSAEFIMDLAKEKKKKG